MLSAPGRPDASTSSVQTSSSVCSECIRLHGRAHAHQVPVAVCPVHPAHRRPHFVLAGPDSRGSRALARGGGGPRGGGHLLRGMGGAGGENFGSPAAPPPSLPNIPPRSQYGGTKT